MKKIIALMLLLFFAVALPAQKKGEVLAINPEGSFNYYYSDVGNISTLIFWEPNRRSGYAVAYNVAGEEVYRSDISRQHGSNMVRFKYHPNGVVKEAHYHWQPDGGIQFGGNYTSFDKQGNKTGFREEKDLWDPGAVKKPVVRPPAKTTSPTPKPQKEPEELEPEPDLPFFRVKYFYVNLTKHPVNFVPLNKKGGLVETDMGRQFRVASGDTVRAGKYYCQDPCYGPVAVLDFNVTARKKRWEKRLHLESIPGKVTPFDGWERRYYLVVEKQ